MTPKKPLPLDDDVIDALIVFALTEEHGALDGADPDDDEYLSWEDRMALDAIPDDLVDHILAGDWESPLPRQRPKQDRRAGWRELAGAMNREGDGDGPDLSDEVRAEIERKIRELTDQEKPSEEPPP